MSVNGKGVQDLRTQFLNKLETSDSDIFHPSDVNRVKTDDNYLNRFLLHNESNIDTALTMLWDTCEWRKKFGANDINEKVVNKDILELGSVFPYGKDKDGKTLLVFKSKKHYKGAFDFEDHKKCLVYWMERLERQGNGEMISLFFDMDGAVLGNMDMDYTKYLISLFKNYYPYFLNYIIIFEMAWVLNAVFKVIKTLLPPKAVEKMKFVNKSSVKDYVDMEYALKAWGGNDYYVYHFEPESKPSTSSASSGEDNRKKVHFADGSFKSDNLNESGFKDATSPASVQNSTGSYLTTSDTMLFTTEGNEVTSSILLTNDDTQPISFKIKTTSPEKFRVRPSSGVLPPGANTTVNVVLLPGYVVQSLQRDKFLVMSIPINHSEMLQNEVNDMWKNTGDKDIRQHKIQCTISQTSSNDSTVKNGSLHPTQLADSQKTVTKLSSDIIKLNTYIGSIKEELKLIRQQQWIIIFSLIVLICSLSYAIYYDHVAPRGSCWADPRNQG